MKKAKFLTGQKTFFPIPYVCPACHATCYCQGAAKSFVCPHCDKTLEFDDADYEKVVGSIPQWGMFFTQKVFLYMGSMLFVVTTLIYILKLLQVPYLINAIVSTAVAGIYLWYFVKYTSKTVEVGITRQLKLPQ